MTTAKCWLAPFVLLLAIAGCGPAAESLSAAQAEPAAAMLAYPTVKEGAGDGQVFEYY